MRKAALFALLALCSTPFLAAAASGAGPSPESLVRAFGFQSSDQTLAVDAYSIEVDSAKWTRDRAFDRHVKGTTPIAPEVTEGGPIVREMAIGFSYCLNFPRGAAGRAAACSKPQWSPWWLISSDMYLDPKPLHEEVPLTFRQVLSAKAMLAYFSTLNPSLIRATDGAYIRALLVERRWTGIEKLAETAIVSTESKPVFILANKNCGKGPIDWLTGNEPDSCWTTARLCAISSAASRLSPEFGFVACVSPPEPMAASLPPAKLGQPQ